MNTGMQQPKLDIDPGVLGIEHRHNYFMSTITFHSRRT